jgi:hypothetical protein
VFVERCCFFLKIRAACRRAPLRHTPLIHTHTHGRASAAMVADKSAAWPMRVAEDFLSVAHGLTRSPRRDRISGIVCVVYSIIERPCVKYAQVVFGLGDGISGSGLLSLLSLHVLIYAW